MPQIKIFRIL